MNPYSPVVIGAMGGSGTRVYHQICTFAGYGMGLWNANNSLDSEPLGRWFYSQWVDRYLKADPSPFDMRQMKTRFRLCLRLGIPIRRERWGWKNPRSLYVLRFLNEQFPTMRFIHVIRDGRDIAFNSKFSYRKHETCLLSEPETQLPDPVRKALHWARLNRLGESYAAEHMQGRYLQSRLEDLCTEPEREVGRIVDFLHSDTQDAVARSVQMIRTPSTLGRWKNESLNALSEVEKAIDDELRHHRYTLNCKTEAPGE